MVLGNTFHLFLSPGPELVAELGGLNRFMRWDAADHHRFRGLSGLLDGPRRRRGRDQGPAGRPDGAGNASNGSILAIEEEGVRFRSYVDGCERFIGPETSMAMQAALGSDIALVFDECTPFHVTRDYTARSMERTHRWLERCLTLARRARPGRSGRLRDHPGRRRARSAHDLRRGRGRHRVRRASRSAARSGRTRRRCTRSWTGRTAELERARSRAPAPPARHRGDRRPDRRGGAGDRHLRLRDADPPGPPRHRDRSRPRGRWRLDLVKSRWRTADEPILDGCPCPACGPAYSRAYLHYLLRARELTGARLVTLHNLGFIARLMADLRAAIDGGRLPEAAAALAGRRRARATPLLRVLVDQVLDLGDRRVQSRAITFW